MEAGQSSLRESASVRPPCHFPLRLLRLILPGTVHPRGGKLVWLFGSDRRPLLSNMSVSHIRIRSEFSR